MIEFDTDIADYNLYRFKFMKSVEAGNNYSSNVVDDGASIPTIGIGFNLRISSTLDAVLNELTGNNVPSGLKADIAAIVANSYSGGTGGTQDLLDQKLSQYHSTYSNVQTTFTLTDTQAEAVYNQIASTYETTLNGDITGIPDSYERVALYSLTYVNNSLIGTNLKNAVNNDNRAEAWYEIRYQSNAGSLSSSPPSDADGIAKRRYYESEMFSLYHDKNHVTNKEALDVYTMTERHASIISTYDGLYSSNITDANASYDKTILPEPQTGQSKQIETTDQSIVLAHDYLIDTYASGPVAHSATIDKIWVDYISNTYSPYDTDPTHEQNSYSGTADNELIFTGAGDDDISGGNGDDTIVINGSGTKTISGGSGNDTLSFLGFNSLDDSGPNGGISIDVVNLRDGTYNQVNNHWTQSNTWGTLTGIENIIGRGTSYTTDLSYVTDHREAYIGDSHNNIFDTKAGSNSQIEGGGGNDTIIWSPEYYGRLDIFDRQQTLNSSFTIQLVGITTSQISGVYNVTVQSTGTTSNFIFYATSQTDALTYQTINNPAWGLIGSNNPDITVTFKNPDGSTVDAKSIFSNVGDAIYSQYFGRIGLMNGSNGGIRSGGDDTDGNGNSGASSNPPSSINHVHQEINGSSTSYIAPVVIDLSGGGIYANDSTHVYLNTTIDGFKVASSWVDANNALLVIDNNANGIIDGLSEMIGTQSNTKTLMNAFTDLRSFYDTNSDGKIDVNDAQFANFKIWTDTNQDGISQLNELQTLTQAAIKSIDLDSVSGSYSYVNGQYVYTETGTVTLTNNSTLAIGNTWIKQNNQNTIYDPSPLDHSIGVNPAIFSLPQLRGFGLLKDLDVQMNTDNNLLSKVSNLANLTASQLLDPSQHFDDKFHDVLYQWVGAPDNWQAHADYANPFELTFANTIAGKNTSIYQWSGSAYANGGWEQSLTYFQGTFLAQTAFHDLFTGSNVHYNINSGTFENVSGLSSAALLSLETAISITSDPTYGWSLVVRTIDAVIGYDNLSTGDHNALDSAIQSTASGWTLSSIHDLINAPPAQLQAPDNNDATLTGTFGDDHIIGLGGNDTLIGGFGDDYLYGYGGNDIYQPGAGYNYMNDGSGNYTDDTYVYGGGHDVIAYDVGGTDKIQFASGITLSDISIERVNALDHSNLNLSNTGTDLIIHVAGQGDIDIHNTYSYSSFIESLEFSNSTTLNLVHLDDAINGNSSDNTLTGADRAYYLSDRLFGNYGNDTLNGGLGQNYLEGGYGNDTYVYGGGLDYIRDNGDGTDTVLFNNTYDPNLFTFQYQTDGTHNDLTILYDGQIKAVLAGQLSSDSHFIEYVTVDGVHTFDLSALDYSIHGTSANDNLYGFDAMLIQDNTMYGNGGDDYMDGRAGNDIMYGGDGNDTMVGGDGNDTLIGGAGDDYLQGDNGTNNLNGGTGANTLNGYYYGNDTFVFDQDALNATNAVNGFSASNDKLELHDLLTGFTPGTSSITDYVQFTTSGSNTVVSVDVDGSGTAHSFQQIATLNYATGLNVSDLYNNGHLTVTS